MKLNFGVKAKLNSLRNGAKVNGNKIKAVLFDMDGVILDSSEIWWKAFDLTLREYGKDRITKKDFLEKYWGRSVEENNILLAKRFGNSKLVKEGTKFTNMKFKELCLEAPLFSGAKQTISSVKSRFKTAMVTNTPRHDVFEILKKHDIEKYFDVVIALEDVQNSKPDPEMIKKACKILRTKPKNAVLIGDTETDILAGRAAGCNTIGIGAKGDITIEKISEASKFLGLEI